MAGHVRLGKMDNGQDGKMEAVKEGKKMRQKEDIINILLFYFIVDPTG